jgi:hypothetical protein
MMEKLIVKQAYTGEALSVTISTTKFNPRRVAVSISCEFIIKPPSPQTAITCRCGYNKAQAIKQLFIRIIGI